VHFTNTTASTSATTGAVKVEGGLGVGGNVHASSNLFVTGNVGIGTTEPTETLDIVGNLNLQKVSNTASIKLNSNVVTEFVRSKKLIKYPRVAMTGDSSGGYVTTSSTVYSTHYRYKAFNGVLNDFFHWENNSFSNTDGSYSAGTQSFEGISGEWLKIELPEKIKPIYTNLFRRDFDGQSPKDFKIYGSIDNSSWTLLTEQTGVTSWSNLAKVYNFNTDTHFKYFVLLVTKITRTNTAGDQDDGTIGEWEIYGIPEYDPDADGTDVIARTVPNVPNTDWLEVYYDARNYSGSGDVQDESGNNRDADMNATFDNGEIKAFNFSGAYTSNVTTSDHGLGTGDVIYTMSFWFKRTAVASTYDYLVLMGDGGSQYEAIVMYIQSNYLRLDHWSAQTTFLERIVLNKWYHVVAGHRGGDTPILANDFIYIDGLPAEVEISGSASTANLNLTGSKLTLGSSHYTTTEFFQGSIANFRLFNRALTGDEVWQLYAYQREYFGHGNLGMTLKSGRLGIGTTEPRAPLDVMGIPYGPGATPRFHVRRKSGTKKTTTAGVVQFDYAEVDSHNGFDPSTYKYTVQVAGTYFLIGDVLVRNTSGNSLVAGSRLEIRSYRGIQNSIEFASYGAGKYNTEITVTVQGIIYLDVGDLVFMYHTAVSNGDVYISDVYQGFSGFLLC